MLQNTSRGVQVNTVNTQWCAQTLWGAGARCDMLYPQGGIPKQTDITDTFIYVKMLKNNLPHTDNDQSVKLLLYFFPAYIHI